MEGLQRLGLGLVIGTIMYFLDPECNTDVFLNIILVYRSQAFTASEKHQEISNQKAKLMEQFHELANSSNFEFGISRPERRMIVKERLDFENRLVQEMLLELEERVKEDYYKWLSEINGS